MSEPVQIGDATLYTGDVLSVLAGLPEESVHCVVTSPPYWGLRDYGIPPTVWDGEPGCVHEWGANGKKGGGAHTGRDLEGHGAETQEQRQAIQKASTGAFCQLCGAWLGSHGLEPTPELYVQHEVQVFRAVRRVLRKDGTLWLNLGDSYAGSGKGPSNSLNKNNPHSHEAALSMRGMNVLNDTPSSWLSVPAGLKAKDLCMIPARVALSLQADGWYLRSMCPWIKRNSMPESCKDRPATAVEYMFLFSKSRRYFYDAQAVRMDYANATAGRSRYAWTEPDRDSGHTVPRSDKRWNVKSRDRNANMKAGRNRRNSDWFLESWQGLLGDEDAAPLAFIVNPKGYKEAHFATFPRKLVQPCILAGCPEHACPKCGAPWVKEVEKPQPPESLRNRGNGSKMDFHTRQTGSGQKLQDWYDAHPGQVTGEHPTCTCGLPAIGGTCLDPFGGSGTTAEVALEYGRRVTLIELKPEYVELQRRRLAPVAGRPLLDFVGGVS